MRKIVLSLSSNFEDMKKNVVKYIDLKSDWENIVVVPDRFSLLMELAIFNEKKVESVFNTNIMPISSLAKYLLEKVGVFYDSVSNTEQMFLTRRAVQKTKEDFVCLPKHTSPNLLQEISKTISQLKASKVSSEDLNIENVSKNLQDKFSDLKLVYDEYETFLGDKLDSSKLLEVFEKNLEKMEYLKNINLFFVGFDSFTNQIFEIIKKLSKQVSQIVIGGFYHFSKANKKAFELDVFEKFSSLSKDYNVEIMYEPSTLPAKAQFAFENVFAYRQDKMINENFAKIYSFNQFDLEIDFVAKQIANRVKDENLRFSDFAIATSSLEEDKTLIENALLRYGLNYFLDTQEKLSSTLLSEFVLQFLNLFINNFDKSSLLGFCCSYFVNSSMEERGICSFLIEKYLSFQNDISSLKKLVLQEDKEKYEKVKSVFELLEKYEKEIFKAQVVDDFTKTLKQLFEDFSIKEKCEARSVELRNQEMLKQEKIYLQLYDKIIEGIDSVNTYLNSESLNIKEYYDLLKVVFENKSISTVPVSSDSIFVGDVSQSFFDARKHLYLVGASASRLPQILFDGGFINDENLQEVEKTLKITPSVKSINKRNKFKLLNLFSYVKESFTVTYSFANKDGKTDFASVFVEDLKNIFLESPDKEIEIVNISNVYFKQSLQKEKYMALSYALNEKILKQFLLKSVKGHNFNKVVTNSVFEVLKKQNKISAKELELLKGEKVLPKINKAKELFFDKDRTKVSQLEAYFISPFLHFVSYGLKLQEFETSEISKLDIGNLLHMVCEKFVKKLTQEKIEIKPVLDEIFYDIKKDKEFYKFFLNKENRSTLNYLKIEAENLCGIILEQKQKSLFKPTHFEKSFKDESYFEKVGLGISGRVDRIDQRKNDFIIFDYKTGKIELNPKVVYLGKKIQLLIYADIYQNQTGKKCSGIFYFPIKNSFEKKQDKKLKGFFDKDAVLALDKTLNFDNPSSNVISADMKINKANISNNVIEFKASTGTDFLQDMIYYAKKVSEKALEEMLEGNIAQVEKQAEFLDGVFEYDMFFKLKNPENMKIKDYIFEKIREEDENRI